MPHYIPRTDKQAPRVINDIPLTIYQSWGTHTVPKKMRETIHKVLKENPEFDYYLYSDEECRMYIKEHYPKEVVQAFDRLRPGAYKSDLWRYCILYKQGGVYFDIKMYPLVPLKDLLPIQKTMLVKDHIQADQHISECIWNGLMISAPGNEIFMECIIDIVASCRTNFYGRNGLDITGPCLLGRMIKRYQPDKFLFYNIFSLTNVINPEDGMNEKIFYNSKVIFISYKEYRKEQKMFQKGLHYHEYWKTKTVYQE